MVSSHRCRALCALTCCVLLFSCERRSTNSSTAMPAGKPYLIGALYPLSGRAALYGEDSKAAAQMACDEINASGGVDGRPLQILFRDDEANAEKARQQARQLVQQDRATFLMGVISSSAALAVTEVSKDTKTIFVGTDHASGRLTYEAFQPYYFRVSNNVYQSMAAQAYYASEQPWSRYYYIGPDYEYGHALWDEFRSKMNTLRTPVSSVGESWPKLFEPDYAAHIASIRGKNPDVLIVGLWGADLISFLRQGSQAGLFQNLPVVSCDAGGNYETFAALGEQMPLGLILSARHHNNWPETDRNRAFVDGFHKRTGRYPSYAAEGAYVGVQFIAEALRQQPDETQTDALVRVMSTIRIQCPEDPEGFVSYMDPSTHQLVQTQAIGRTVPNSKYPPATRMLGEWKVYDAERLIPSLEEVERRRNAKP